MGRHSQHSESTQPDNSAGASAQLSVAQKILAGALALAGLLTVIGTVWLWPSSEEPHIAEGFSLSVPLAHKQVDGTVAVVQEGACDSPSSGQVFETAPAAAPSAAAAAPPAAAPSNPAAAPPAAPPASAGAAGSPTEPDRTCTHSIVDLTSGDDAGMRTLLITNNLPGDPELKVGDHIRMLVNDTPDGGTQYAFSDFQRGTPITVWMVLTALGIVLIGGWRGMRALVGLGVTLAGIAGFLLPSLLRGGDPLWLSVVTGSLVLFIVIYLVHGLNWKSSAALAGTIAALLIAALLGRYAISTTGIRGLGDEDNLLIQLYLPDVTVPGLMLCGFIIGALGVLNDVTIAQASTVNELYELNPRSTPWEVFTSAMRVGRDHIASMVYTLVLSYTGAALPLLLLLSVADRPLSNTLTSDIMATELMRSAVGALALCLAVPITTAIAAVTVGPTANTENNPSGRAFDGV
ncbi:YibE/F-like protein [Corynebacterium ciconiae DSM 44920]|uniref:YibE/F family protein n=1 Tax=Corynebacterium ciconiae TaxID=227319 RepID=UPI0003799068|nr:YibE/F family protein [Corynebacterium ciconiae]WKD62129.1 YibE/F-like protein [Corynebacterium ciconiae DSM 44920]